MSLRASHSRRAALVGLFTIAALVGGASPAVAAAPKIGAIIKQAGGVRATLTYARTGNGVSTPRVYGKLRLTITAPGRTSLRRLMLSGEARSSMTMRPALTLADVTGDGVLDVVVDTFTGGAHCCSVSAIVRSTPKTWESGGVQNWADHSYRLKDLGGSPTPEFVTDDKRFTAAYSSYAASASPIRIYSAEDDALTPVTRQFPDAIRADEQGWASDYATVAATPGNDPDGVHEFGRAVTAARVADLVLVADYTAAKSVLAEAEARGDFAGFKGFRGQLGHDLKAWNYLLDPTVIGLTDTPVR